LQVQQIKQPEIDVDSNNCDHFYLCYTETLKDIN